MGYKAVKFNIMVMKPFNSYNDVLFANSNPASVWMQYMSCSITLRKAIIVINILLIKSFCQEPYNIFFFSLICFMTTL